MTSLPHALLLMLLAVSPAIAQTGSTPATHAQTAGVPVVLVDPAYTSKTCHLCGHRGYRSGLRFICTTCGVFDADLNAAQNIAARGARVTEPEGAPSGSVKAAAL